MLKSNTRIDLRSRRQRRPLVDDRRRPQRLLQWFLTQVLRRYTALTHVSSMTGCVSSKHLLQGPRLNPVGRLAESLRGVLAPRLCHRGRGTPVRPSRLADRRLVVHHARCRRAASLRRPAGKPGQDLRFPDGPHPGVVPRRHLLLPEVSRRRCNRLRCWRGEFFLC